ncbi:unnamed protein product [Cyprideis torosa]|uniref:Uncharacterized protein n=1 Tax=Cyprideis torosa TaxID=163714 RepID=A0A7R8W7N6_9CRUS|nr:unnamed protein product [Cyprideis torosa]CAG0882905.1 unnamed protein product [Cyprideis torosa]
MMTLRWRMRDFPAATAKFISVLGLGMQALALVLTAYPTGVSSVVHVPSPRSSSEEYGGSPSEEAGSPSGFDGSRRASSHGDLISGFNIQPSCQDSEGCETPVPTPEPDAGLAMALPLVAEPGGMELEARRDAERNFRGRRRSVSKKREDGNNNVETSKVEGGAQSSPVHGRSLIGPTSSSAPLPTPTPLSTSTAASTTLSSQDLTEVEDTGLLPFDLTYSIGQEDSEPVVCKLHDEGVAIPSPRSSFSMPRGGNLKYLSTSDGSTRSADAPEGLPQYEADLPPSPPEFQVLDETPRGPPKLIYDPAYNTKKSLVKKISRCKLELKWLRDERNDGRAQRTKQNEKENLASTVQEIEKRLKELRLESNRPESLSDMDEDQIVAEKLCLQRGLIFLEREHGRPTNKEAKQVVFRLYDRYRTLKRLIARAEAVKASSLIPIAEHVEMATFEYEISVQRRGSAEEDETNTAPGTIEGPISPSRHPYNDSSPVAGYTEEELAQSVLTQALEGSSDDPLTELKREREKLLDQRRDLKAKIRSYEDTFERAGGGSPAGMSRSIDDRRLRSGPTEDDRAPLDKIYRQYKEVRARIRLTEALLTKQGQRI